MGLDNAEIGLLLTIGAGLATSLGAGVVFFKPCVQLASKRVLAAGAFIELVLFTICLGLRPLFDFGSFGGILSMFCPTQT